jgi:hypothetical protein
MPDTIPSNSNNTENLLEEEQNNITTPDSFFQSEYEKIKE